MGVVIPTEADRSKMKLAVNYSNPTVGLWRSGQIDLDLLKCPDWPDLLDSLDSEPVYVHFSLQGGTGRLNGRDLDLVESLQARSACTMVNCHLAPLAQTFPGRVVSDTDAAAADVYCEKLVADLRTLALRFGADRVMLENSKWNPNVAQQVPQAILEPETFVRVIEEAGVRFLLDVSHAIAAARFRGEDERAYIASMPAHQLAELHVVGLEPDGNGWWLDHSEIQPENWPVIEWVCDQIHRGRWPEPWAMVFEYGGLGPWFENRSDPEVLTRQVPRLHRLAHPAVGGN